MKRRAKCKPVVLAYTHTWTWIWYFWGSYEFFVQILVNHLLESIECL